MNETFSSDSFILRLRTAWRDGDMDEAAAMLWPHVMRIGRVILRRSVFSFYTAEDREDALQDAVLYVLDKMGGFLNDPRNDPKSDAAIRYTERQKSEWLHTCVYLGIRHSARRILRGNKNVSLEAPVSGQDEGISLDDILPAPGGTPEDILIRQNTVEQALRAFFGLPNDPATVAAVGYIILWDALEQVRMPLEIYTALLRQTDAAALAESMEHLLINHGIDPEVLLPLKKRLGKTDQGSGFMNLTARKLANRKNSMLTVLRRLKNSPGGLINDPEGSEKS